MDSVPRIVVEPSHERLQDLSVGLLTSMKPLFWHDSRQSPYQIELTNDREPRDQSPEAEIRTVVLNQYHNILTKASTLLQSNSYESHPSAKVSNDPALVYTIAVPGIFNTLIKSHHDGKTVVSATGPDQNGQIIDCLQQAIEHLRSHQDYLSIHSPSAEHDHYQVPATQDLMLSLQCLIEFVWDSTLPRCHLSSTYSMTDPHRFWMQNALVTRLLQNAGWQHSDISALPKDIRFRYYLSFFRKGSLESRRRPSSAVLPKVQLSIQQHYSAIHISSDCHCARLKVDLDAQNIRTDDVHFNLVTYSRLADRPSTLRLRRMKISSEKASDLSFVAFSHVRSDGLGSSLENGLPACQVEFLQDLSDKLLVRQDHPTPFYIDTLCIPLRGHRNRSALRNMRFVFRKAHKVLVLDKELITTAASPLPHENLTRIRYSVFMRRLFTVAECAVSQNVYFYFHHGVIVSLNELYSSYDKNEEYPLLSIVSFKDRKQNTLTTKDFKTLSLALGWLSDDLHVLQMHPRSEKFDTSSDFELNPSSNPDTKDSGHKLGLDRRSLRKLLRLGFLALPRMRYFAEAAEAELLDDTANSILQVYGDAVNRLRSKNNASHKRFLLLSNDPEEFSPRSVLNRLEKLQQFASTISIQD